MTILASVLLVAALAATESQSIPAAIIEERARQALVGLLAETGSQAELRLLPSLQDQTLPAGHVTLVVGDIAGRLPRSQVSVPVRLEINGRAIRTLIARFELRDLRAVLSYTDAYAARFPSNAIELKSTQVDMVCCAGKPVDDVQQLAGLRLKRSVYAGHPVLVEDFEALPDVQAQLPVAIEVAFGQIWLTTLGTALTDGRIGERVSVRAAASGEIVKAQVIARQKVAVHE